MSVLLRTTNPALPVYPTAARGLRLGVTLHQFLLLKNRRARDENAYVLEALADVGFPVTLWWKKHEWQNRLTLGQSTSSIPAKDHHALPYALKGSLAKLNTSWAFNGPAFWDSAP